jgi:hypothetical protein
MNTHTAELLVPEPESSLVEVKIDIGNLKSYKSPTQLIKAGDETLRSEKFKLIPSIWNKDELPQQRKENTVAPIYKNGDKDHCNNYSGISLLSTAYTILSNTPLARLIP